MRRQFGAWRDGHGHGLACVLLVLLLSGCKPSAAPPPAKSSLYLYGDTRQLVEFVESAAALIEQSGTRAFVEFERPDSRWRTSPTYLFVYELDGTCVWHGLDRSLIGRNLISFRDALGIPVIKDLTDIGRRPERDAGDWIFYLWQEQAEFQPTWKSSYVRKAVTADGKVLLVGSGSSRLKMEKFFVQRKVDQAAALLHERGRDAAFDELKEIRSGFYFLGTFVFVLDKRGHTLVDPAYPTLGGRDMTLLRDATGRPIVEEVLSRLRTAEAAWVQFLWPRPGELLPARKVMYIRKVEVDGETLLVGCDFYLATPVWMKL